MPPRTKALAVSKTLLKATEPELGHFVEICSFDSLDLPSVSLLDSSPQPSEDDEFAADMAIPDERTEVAGTKGGRPPKRKLASKNLITAASLVEKRYWGN